MSEGNTITGTSHFLLAMANEKLYRYYELDPIKQFALTFAGTFNRNDNIYTGSNAKYGVVVGGYESYTTHSGVNSSWLGIRPNNSLTYFRDVYINRDSGNPVEIIK